MGWPEYDKEAGRFLERINQKIETTICPSCTRCSCWTTLDLNFDHFGSMGAVTGRIHCEGCDQIFSFLISVQRG